MPLSIYIANFKTPTSPVTFAATFKHIRCGKNQAPQYTPALDDIYIHIKDEIVIKLPDASDDLTKVKYLSYKMQVTNQTSGDLISVDVWKKWVDFQPSSKKIVISPSKEPSLMFS